LFFIRSRRVRRERSEPPIVTLRFLFATLLLALFAIAIVLLFIQPTPSSTSPRLLLSLLVATFLLGVLRARLADRRIDSAESAPRALALFQGAFFIKMGVWEVTPLLGFVGAFVTGRKWIYFLGLGLAVLASPLIAPTAGSVDRAQAGLDAHGVDVDLWQVLRRPSRT
jgi:F0F1-type ATP synthase membrane subunit c/vacuolar-type H+-ATPase subunit K